MVDFCKPRSIYTMLRGSKSNISCICDNQENEGEHRKYEDFSENWDNNYPPIAPLSWRRSFCQLRKQWSDFARNIDDERNSTSENADEENASFRPNSEEFPDSANPKTVQYSNSDDSINDNPTLCCKYQESLADRSDDLQGMTEEVLEETSPQVESLLRRSCMSNGEKRVVVDNFLIKFLLDPVKKDCLTRSMIRRSSTTFEELRNTLIYSIKRKYAKLEGKKNSVRALVQALIRNERVQRKTLRFIFSKEPAHASFAESDSFQKVQDEVWALAKGGDVNNDKTRAKIESKLRTSTLSEDEKELIIDRVLTENVLDANVRNIFGKSMRIRSTMSTDERNHNIIKLLECINLPSAQKSDITTIVLEDCPSGYHFESDLSQYNVESAINALTFHIASAHNSREHQGRNDFHSKQTKLASRMESQDCVESHSKSKLSQSAGISRGTNYCERQNPNNTHEIEIEQNPIGNPICYPVYQCKNTRNATKTSKYSDLKSNLFPENFIYDCSNKRTVSRKYKKSKYCYNPTCAVQLRKQPTNPEKFFKEFFQEIPYDSNTSDGRCIPVDACRCKYEYNEKKCIYSGLCEKLKSETHIEHEIFEGQQLQNVGSGAHLHLKQKKSRPSQFNIFPCSGNTCRKMGSKTLIEHEIFDGQQLQNVCSGAHLQSKHKKSQPSQLRMYPCNGNTCRKMESRPYIEHEIFDGRQLQNVCSGAHSQSKHKKSRASLITMYPDNSNSCRKVESRPYIEHEIFAAQKLENVCSGVNLQLGQIKSVPSHLILDTYSCNPCRKLERESCVKNASFGGEQLENVGCGSHLQFEQKKSVPSLIAMATSSCNPCRKLETESCFKNASFGGEQLENVGCGSHLQFEQKKSVPSQITMDSCSCNPCSCNPYSCNPCRKLKRKSCVKQDIFDGEQLENVACGSHLQLEQKKSVPSQITMDTCSCNPSGKLKRKSYVKQDIFDGDQVENVGCGSHLQLEQKESVPRQLFMDLGECNSLQSSIKPYKCNTQYSHEFFSCDSNCRRSHEDCTLCVCVSKVKYLTKKCKELFSMKTLCRLLQCISFFGRFMWLPILVALIWFFCYKKDDSVRCFMYCRKC